MISVLEVHTDGCEMSRLKDPGGRHDDQLGEERSK